MECLIRALLVEDLEEAISLPPIEEGVDNHKGALALLDVLAEGAPLLSVVVRLHRNDIVHDLEGSPEHIDKGDNLLLLLSVLVGQRADEAGSHAWQTRALVLNHLEILRLGRHSFFLTMPMDVPPLAKVNRCHLLRVGLVHSEGLHRVRHVVTKFRKWVEVHEVPCVYRNVCSKFLVCAEVSPALLAAILNIVDHQTSIVHNFCESAAVVDVFVCLEVFQVISAEAARQDQTKHRSPSLATAVEQVVHWIMECFVDSIDVG